MGQMHTNWIFYNAILTISACYHMFGLWWAVLLAILLVIFLDDEGNRERSLFNFFVCVAAIGGLATIEREYFYPALALWLIFGMGGIADAMITRAQEIKIQTEAKINISDLFDDTEGDKIKKDIKSIAQKLAKMEEEAIKVASEVFRERIDYIEGVKLELFKDEIAKADLWTDLHTGKTYVLEQGVIDPNSSYFDIDFYKFEGQTTHHCWIQMSTKSRLAFHKSDFEDYPYEPKVGVTFTFLDNDGKLLQIDGKIEVYIEEMFEDQMLLSGPFNDLNKKDVIHPLNVKPKFQLQERETITIKITINEPEDFDILLPEPNVEMVFYGVLMKNIPILDTR